MVEFGDTNVKNTILESKWFALSNGEMMPLDLFLKFTKIKTTCISLSSFYVFSDCP